MPTLVVASQQRYVIRVSYLERKEEQDAFAGKVTSVDVITEKKVTGRGGIATDFQKFHKVEILAVYVATDYDEGSES